MSKSKLLAVFLAALMVLSVLAVAPAAAQPTFSASDSTTSASPGDTGVQVTYTVTNNGDSVGEANVTVQNNTLPSGWSVTDISGSDPTSTSFSPLERGSEVFFGDVQSGETVTVTATVDVPSGASDGDYTLDATAYNVTGGNSDLITNVASTIQVSGQNGGQTTPTPTPSPSGNAVSIERVNVVDGSGVAGGAITVHDAADNPNDALVEVSFNDTVTSVSDSGWEVEFEDESTEEADSVNLNGNGPSATMVFDGGFDTGDAFNVTDVVLDGASVNGDSIDTDEEVDAVATAGAAEDNANKSVWTGEQAAIISDSTGEDLYVQRDDGTFVSSPATAANNQIYIFNTADRDTGEYHVDFDGDERRWNAGGDEVVLKLRDLGLNIEADDTSIDDGDDAEADVSANTGSRTLRLGVQDDDGDFVSGKNMTDELDPSTEETINFGTLDDGDYTYYVEDLRTGISAESDTVTVSETDEDVEFNQSTFSEHRGDVMNITIDLEDADVATIGLGPYDDVGYGWNVTVENDDDNDYVTLQWNTFAASGSANDVSVPGDDNLVSIVDSQSDVGGPAATDIISSGTYDIDVRVGDDPTDDADAVATATIQPRSTDAVNTWTAPGAEASDISDKEDVYDRIGINITQDETIAEGDVLISQIEASGLQGAIYAENRDDPTDAFAELSGWNDKGQADNAMSLALNQTNTQLNRAPKSTDIGQAYANDAVALIPDYENDTYFVAWTLGDADFERQGTAISLDDGDQFVTNFTVFSYEESSSDYGLVAPDDGDFADETVTSEWEFVDAEMSINTQRGDVVRVSAQPNQTVSGTSTLATGSEHDIRVQTKQGSANAFLLGPEDVTVDNGTWSIEFNFTDRQPGTELNIEARDDVADTEEEDGLVMDEPTVQALTFEDQDSGGSSVTVQEAQLSDGGFIAIHEGSASGDVLGTTRYIDPGEEATNLGVGLSSDVSDGTTLVAMPHLDTNSNERFDFPDADGPYTEDGSPVTESATITVRGEQTPPPTPTPQVITATPPDTPTPRVVTVTPEETPGQDGPGFGVVVALIALIAAALLAVRRNN